VVLENGREFRAEKTILATGAWSSRLVKLDGILNANAVGIAYIKLTEEEHEKYRHMGCHTNLISGVNIFTPIDGLSKILHRVSGVRNTSILKDPEDPSATYRASYPRTAVDDSTQTLPLSMEQALRDEMRKILPAVCRSSLRQNKGLLVSIWVLHCIPASR
jgi:sarcosine oxidase / L-pipecolate oxidase